MSLSSAQKRTIVIGQETFIKSFKIVQVQHFTKETNNTFMLTENNTNEIMLDNEMVPLHPTINLRKTTVMEFMLEHYIAGDGLALFTYIFTPIKGVMEVLVDKDHLLKARDCLEQIWQDIRFYANDTTIEKILYPIVIEDTSMRDYIPWKPF